MKYKKGDRVLLYSWEELCNMYTLDSDGDIRLSKGTYWSKQFYNKLPSNRIVIISTINSNYIGSKKNDIDYWTITYMVKCHANEYYLQQIKDEL